MGPGDPPKEAKTTPQGDPHCHAEQWPLLFRENAKAQHQRAPKTKLARHTCGDVVWRGPLLQAFSLWSFTGCVETNSLNEVKPHLSYVSVDMKDPLLQSFSIWSGTGCVKTKQPNKHTKHHTFDYSKNLDVLLQANFIWCGTRWLKRNQVNLE